MYMSVGNQAKPSLIIRSGTESKTALNIGHTLKVTARYRGLLLAPAECFRLGFFCALGGKEEMLLQLLDF